ncbi:MAG: hypothetical protein WB919_23900 [Candidatus Sulfotelmatobacter sp.]
MPYSRGRSRLPAVVGALPVPVDALTGAPNFEIAATTGTAHRFRSRYDAGSTEASKTVFNNRLECHFRRHPLLNQNG